MLCAPSARHYGDNAPPCSSSGPAHHPFDSVSPASMFLSRHNSIEPLWHATCIPGSVVGRRRDVPLRPDQRWVTVTMPCLVVPSDAPLLVERDAPATEAYTAFHPEAELPSRTSVQ
jgi:hypothetical protein